MNPYIPIVDAGLAVRELLNPDGRNNGYVVVGTIGQLGGARILVVRTNGLGVTLRRRAVSGTMGDAVAYDVEVIRDPRSGAAGHLIVTGSIDDVPYGQANKGQRIFVMSMSMAGVTLWPNRFGLSTPGDPSMPEENVGFTIRQVADVGYAIAGCSASGRIAGDRLPCIVRIDANGALLWAHVYSAPTGPLQRSYGVARGLVQTNDGGFVVTGLMKTYGNNPQDAFLLRVRGDGTPLWLKTYDAVNGSGRSQTDGGYDLTLEANASYTIAGRTSFSQMGLPVDHAFLLRITPDGRAPIMQRLYNHAAAGGPSRDAERTACRRPRGCVETRRSRRGRAPDRARHPRSCR